MSACAPTTVSELESGMACLENQLTIQVHRREPPCRSRIGKPSRSSKCSLLLFVRKRFGKIGTEIWTEMLKRYAVLLTGRNRRTRASKKGKKCNQLRPSEQRTVVRASPDSLVKENQFDQHHED